MAAATGLAIGGLAVSSPTAVAAGPRVEVHPGLQFVVNTQLDGTGPEPIIRALVTWERSDPSGICAQRVKVREVGAAAVETITVSKRSRQVPLDLVVGRRYRVTVVVKGCDKAFNSASDVYSAQLLQETVSNSYLDPGGPPWSINRSRGASGGTVARGEGQAVLFASARSVAVVGKRAPGLGTAYVAGRFGESVVDFDGPRAARMVMFAGRWDELTATDDPIIELLPNGPVVLDAWLIG